MQIGFSQILCVKQIGVWLKPFVYYHQLHALKGAAIDRKGVAIDGAICYNV
jgi:hypothetical protein